MNILIGSLQHETNTFSPVTVERKDFDYLRGDKIFEKLPVKELFTKAGARLIPTIYANALPSGKVSQKTFTYFKEKILTGIPEDGILDGVWLYLHGAMEVDGIGSGEADLVTEIRKRVGPEVPIAVALDFHANNTERLVESANIICGYRTAPHVDQRETQLRAAGLLIKCIEEDLLPRPVMSRPPLILTGDKVTTTIDPMKSLIEELIELDRTEDVLTASIFNGQPWVDAPNTCASVVVVPGKDQKFARDKALRLAGRFWEARYDFRFEEEAYQPERAVEEVLKDASGGNAQKITFITDSGDNTTAGAAGDNTLLLRLILQKAPLSGKVLVGGITDQRVVRELYEQKTGEQTRIELGASLDVKSESIYLEGRIKTRGRIIGWSGEDAGSCVVVSSMGVDILITEKRSALISPEHFMKAGISLLDYDLVVVKQGYLFPELKAVAGRTILALTPGASCEDIAKIDYQRIQHPLYPCDKNFDWSNREVVK